MKSTPKLAASLLITALLLVSPVPAFAADGWTALFDGKSLSGWKVAEHPDSVRVEDSMIVCDGPRAHAFYVGEAGNADFRNFELKVTAMTRPGANSGVYFHTKYQENGFPTQGYEIQINNTHTDGGKVYKFKRTGSLYGVRNQYKDLVQDNQWFTFHVVVTGKRVQISVNRMPVVDHTEPVRPVRSPKWPQRRLSHGTFALQCHDPGSKVFFKNIRVKPLPDDLSVPPVDQSVVDRYYSEISRLQAGNFPLVDFHVHLKGGLTLDEALANSRKVGINYGIAPNCGVGFPITDDEGIYKFVEEMKGRPVFLGMQAEGREWVDTFSKEAIEQFDYVFSDAMTFTDRRGKRIRLWIEEEVEIDDEQAFVQMCVEKIVSVLSDEPIDIYVNPTFLPAAIADRYDELWTEERMDRVIDAAAKNKVAIEINARYRLPSPKFIKRAKKAGVKFAMGTNNSDRNLGRLEYCLDMIRECGLTARDMFIPKHRTDSNRRPGPRPEPANRRDP